MDIVYIFYVIQNLLSNHVTPFLSFYKLYCYWEHCVQNFFYKFKYIMTIKLDVFNLINKKYFTIIKHKTKKTKISEVAYFYPM